jgi:hypothetical protein
MSRKRESVCVWEREGEKASYSPQKIRVQSSDDDDDEVEFRYGELYHTELLVPYRTSSG